MSYCSLMEFQNGKADKGIDFQNSWGGSARIWNSLFETYCKDPTKPWDSWLSAGEGDRRLWDLVTDDRLSEPEQAVHAFTLDLFYVSKANFKRLAGHLREFVKIHPTAAKDHLIAWAAFIEKSKAEAIGLHGTSVSDNLWFRWDEENDCFKPYDMTIETEHQEVYEFIDNADDEAARE